MKWLHSRLIRKTFVSYMALLYVFLFALAIFTFRDVKKKAQEEVESDCFRSAKAMAFSIDQNFSRIQSTALKLSQFPWVWSFSVTKDSFEDQFLPIRRREIVSDLQIVAENDNLLQNLTVFFPLKDVAVSSKGWFAIDRYLSMVKSNLPQLREALHLRRDFDVVYLDREAMDKNPVIWMLDTLDYASSPRIQLAFSFDKNILANWVSEISFSRLHSFTLYSAEGTPLVKISGPRNETALSHIRTTTIPAESFGWYYEISYDPTLLEVPLDNFFQWVWVFAIAMLVGPFAAWFLTYCSCRPIQTLMEKIGQSGTQDSSNEYRVLEDTFMRLTEDNSNMKLQVSEYREFVQHDLSMRLLKGYFDRSEVSRELAYYGIDYTEDNRFCVLIVTVADLGVAEDSKSGMDSRMMATLLLRQILEEGPYQSRMIQVLDEDAVVILSDQKAPLEDAALDDYLNELKHSTAFSLEIWRGQIEPRIIGISKSYHAAREQRFAAADPVPLTSQTREGPFSSFYYPTDWEIQLINGVKAGSMDLVAKILKELRQENENRHLDKTAQIALFTSLEDTVIRLATELNEQEICASPRPEWGGAAAGWTWVGDCLERLCQRMKQRKEKDQDVGRQILAYVQQNFESANLSLKEIAQELGIALSTASKAFKNVTQMNFYDYTCRLRMEKVKRLMAEGEFSVRALCSQVGYENEYSLRRTFQRYEGISITEYREKIKQSKENGEKK